MSRLMSLSIFAVFLAAIGWLSNTLYKAELRNPLIYRWFNLDPGENAAWLSTETDLPCTKLEVIYARGSLEPRPIGFLLGPRFKQEITKRLHSDKHDEDEVLFIGLDYPAIFSGSSLDKGIELLAERVARRSKQCPDMSFALTGYSQGADVIRYSLDQLALYAARISSIVVFGDPLTSIGYPSYYAPRVLSLCNPGDRGCGGAEILGHFGYGSAKNHLLTVAAAEWVVSKARDSSPGEGRKFHERLPVKGEGGQFLLPWLQWPPTDWQKLYTDGEKVQVIGARGVDKDELWAQNAEHVKASDTRDEL